MLKYTQYLKRKNQVAKVVTEQKQEAAEAKVTEIVAEEEAKVVAKDKIIFL